MMMKKFLEFAFRNQLMDILGCAQTLPIQEALLKVYTFENVENIDHIERYLWAISVNRDPNLQFLNGKLFVTLFTLLRLLTTGPEIPRKVCRRVLRLYFFIL